MTPVLVIAGILIGLVVVDLTAGSWLIGETRWLAMVAGGVIGALWARLILLQRRVNRLEQSSTDQPEKQPQAVVPASTAGPATTTPDVQSAPTAKPEPEHYWSEPARSDSRGGQTQANSARPRTESGKQLAWLRRWFTEGNVPVKIGVLVLFVGVAALLRYATEQGWLAMPIEFRLLAVAIAAIAGLVFAWRQRQQRRVFALALQGGAIGVLALTVFAAFRLYDVLPAAAAFAMLVVLTGSTGVLAVVQNARALAILALVAGFAAPLLVATGQGNHIALFGWYALLNLGIFGVAWYRAWPVLNRLGFAFTFVIGTVWGVLSYTPDHYQTTQPFLLLFFALYLIIPILNALRSDAADQTRLDAVLVFGLPLFAFPLQAALLDGDRLAIAFSALTLSLIYLATAALLLKRWDVRPLGKSHAVLAIGFATLAVPFAFSGSTVVMIWALEGAALVWFGLYQQHRLSRLAGLALQALAGLIWLAVLLPGPEHGLPVVNAVYLGGLALTIALAISAWRYADAGASDRLVNFLALTSLLAWSLAGMAEVYEQTEAALVPDTLLLLAAMTALLAALAHRYRAWTVTGVAPAIALASGAVICFMQQDAHQWPLGGWGAAVWLLYIVSAWVAQLHLEQAEPRWRGLAALAAHLAVVIMLSMTLVHVGDEMLNLGEGWLWLAGGLPLLVLCAWQQSAHRALLSPASLPASQFGWLGNCAYAVLVIGLLVSLGSSGAATPLGYLPVLNPLEIGQLAALVLIGAKAMAQRRAGNDLLPWVAALGFLVVTVMVLRGVHHLAGINWSSAALFSSRIGQSALSVCWTAMGVVAWIIGSRRGNRALWFAGAIILGIVLGKLLLIDRTFLSTVAGIVSFLAFGLLSILVGYLAPAPPRSLAPETEQGKVQ